ncbi:MAG TPA: hypothetical protein VGK46_05770, partial [Saprospiraceae bacterium]
MKYLLLLLIISGFTFTGLNGQVNFVDSTNIWTEVHYYLIGHQSIRYTMSTDTVQYNGKVYHEVLSSIEEDGETWGNTWNFIRYEDQKLFGGYSNGEYLIFDYSLEVNDTLYPDSGPTYVVTAIDSVSLGNGEKRKRLHTQCPNGSWGDWTIYWIEGLPSSAGLIEHHSICAADAGSALMCIWKNDELLYSNPEQDSCWLIPVATLEIEQTNIRILPNPVESWLDISDPDQMVVEVKVYDFMGRQIYRVEELNINMESAPQGY